MRIAGQSKCSCSAGENRYGLHFLPDLPQRAGRDKVPPAYADPTRAFTRRRWPSARRYLSAEQFSVAVLFLQSVMIVAAASVERFLDVPAAVHLTGLDVPERFSQLGIDRLGAMKTVVIRQQPLNALQVGVKRAFDVVVASVALLLLSPLLLLTAVLIKLDTPGPALFVQRRRGFNHKEFRIYKFRTMTTADDGDEVPQATAGDPRVTRIGRNAL